MRNELRNDRREPEKIKITVSGTDIKGMFFEEQTETIDLSPTGLSFYLNARIFVSTLLSLNLNGNGNLPLCKTPGPCGPDRFFSLWQAAGCRTNLLIFNHSPAPPARWRIAIADAQCHRCLTHPCLPSTLRSKLNGKIRSFWSSL